MRLVTGAGDEGLPPIDAEDWIEFGDIPASVNVLLQRGVAEYRDSRTRAEILFQRALELAPEVLPVYFCLYKIYAYQSNLDAQALVEAARQSGWPADNHVGWSVVADLFAGLS